MKNYSLNFNGYYLEDDTSLMPNSSGVYLVYGCIHDVSSRSLSLVELIYIGQATELKDRIENHEKKELFLKSCKFGETLCYAVALVPTYNLDIVENALIYVQKPRLNTKFVNSFNYERPVHFTIMGDCLLLNGTDFII